MIVFKTNTGKIREINQDAIFIGENLFAVADGMGGHKAGEIASNMAIEVMKRYDIQDIDEKTIISIFETANSDIYNAQLNNNDCSGMGTTLTAVWKNGKNIIIGHVGDSRLYVYRDSKLTQITTDHTYVARMVKAKLLDEEAARKSPYRHYIDRAVGLESKLKVDIIKYELHYDDVLLLCSDGLSSLVPRTEIEKTINKDDIQSSLDELMNRAMQAGGNDNISIILIKDDEVKV